MQPRVSHPGDDAPHDDRARLDQDLTAGSGDCPKMPVTVLAAFPLSHGDHRLHGCCRVSVLGVGGRHGVTSGGTPPTAAPYAPSPDASANSPDTLPRIIVLRPGGVDLDPIDVGLIERQGFMA